MCVCVHVHSHIRLCKCMCIVDIHRTCTLYLLLVCYMYLHRWVTNSSGQTGLHQGRIPADVTYTDALTNHVHNKTLLQALNLFSMARGTQQPM